MTGLASDLRAPSKMRGLPVGEDNPAASPRKQHSTAALDVTSVEEVATFLQQGYGEKPRISKSQRL